MANDKKWVIACGVLLVLSSAFGYADEHGEQERMRMQDAEANEDRRQSMDQGGDRERIFGYELMTPEERSEHMNRMQNAESDEERERIRMEHRERMMERAEEQGVSIHEMGQPDNGMGPGNGRQGSGDGAGKGNSSGQGSGKSKGN